MHTSLILYTKHIDSNKMATVFMLMKRKILLRVLYVFIHLFIIMAFWSSIHYFLIFQMKKFRDLASE